MIPLIPTARDLISHEIVVDGVAPHRSFKVVFTYPDCTRTVESGDRHEREAHWSCAPFDPRDSVVDNRKAAKAMIK